jgi:hypothetical protein
MNMFLRFAIPTLAALAVFTASPVVRCTARADREKAQRAVRLTAR